MPGNNGHDKPPENKLGCLSLHELSHPRTSINGATEPRRNNDALPKLDHTKLYVLVILLPLYYNPDETGNRMPVERDVFEETFAEIRQFGSGYRLYEGEGWCHSMKFRGDFDGHVRIEIDALFSDEDVAFLQSWKKELTLRFQQDSVYMSLSGPVIGL
jgi:hypothetical protein